MTTTTPPSSAPTEVPAEAPTPFEGGPSTGLPTPPSTPEERERARRRRRDDRVAIGIVVALVLVVPIGAYLLVDAGVRNRQKAPTVEAPTHYVPALTTSSAEDQRRFLAEAASEHFVRVWQQPATPAERLAALAPLMTPGAAARPGADTSPPTAEWCCAPQLIQADERGALWLTRLSDGSTVEIRGIFTGQGQFLVADVQG